MTNYRVKVVEIRRPLKLCENVHYTGELGMGIKEQSLIMHTKKGLIVMQNEPILEF